MTNYVTSEVPRWTEIPWLVWGVFGGLVVVSVALQLWSRRLDADEAGGGVPRLVPVDHVVASGAAGSLVPPRPRSTVRGRAGELDVLAELLRRPGGRFAVVCGTGGIGKTTLAAALAQHAAGAGHAVFWVTWRDPEQFAQDMLRVAVACGLPEDAVEAARAGRAHLADVVWGQLAVRGKWLLVLDSLDAPEAVGPSGAGPLADYRGWVRPVGGGLLLVTSRDMRTDTWGPDAKLTRMETLANEPGASVLLDLAPAAGNREEAAALAERLGGLPLALQAAGRYLAAPGSRYRTFPAYRVALDTELGALLGVEHPHAADPTIARMLVHHTWELSLTQLECDGHHFARPVLRLLSLMAPTPAPSSFITPALVEEVTGRPADPAVVEAAINGLHAYGLLHTPNTDGTDITGCVALHPLVQEITAHSLTAQATDLADWHQALAHQFRRSIDVVRAAGPSGQPQADLLVPHVLAIGIPPGAGEDVELAVAQLSNLQESAARYTDVLSLCELLLAVHTRRYGSEHADTLSWRSNLAHALWDLGRYQEAADLHLEVLATRQRLLGDDPLTWMTRSNVANAYFGMGRHEEASDLHAEVLAARERLLGPDHPDTLTSRNNLAQAFTRQGRHQEAADIDTQNLAARIRLLGPDHPDPLTSRNNLANSFIDLGRRHEAAALHTEVLASRERVLGPDHPDT
ncbi:tetratricopeptide repeat protein, partial [Streptomyces sp. NRRL S-118]|uniref:tetratricopeptide repeat protein n=1 Tax=Streptomyces sp. NRRL S-118 TaxID=1463881 RepID=UPI00131E9F3A